MLGKLLDACMHPTGWRFALTAHGTCRERAVDIFFFTRSPEKKWVHENGKRKFPQRLRRPVTAWHVSTLWLTMSSDDIDSVF